MSRRITLLVLAASAALIATQASADPECFGDSCGLPESVEPPAAAMQPPDGDGTAASEASAAVVNVAPAKLLPQVMAEPMAAEPVEPAARRSLRPVRTFAHEASAPREPVEPAARRSLRPVRTFADEASAPREPVEPAVRRPLRPVQTFADEASAPQEPVRLAPRIAKVAPTPEPAPAGYVRSVQVSSPDPSYVVSQNAAPVGGIVVVGPSALYAAGRPGVFMIAPSAKIISIDGDD